LGFKLSVAVLIFKGRKELLDEPAVRLAGIALSQ